MAHQRLAAGDNDKHPIGIGAEGNTVEHTRKIGKRHVCHAHLCSAVAAAMTAMQIATLSALPEKLS